MITVKQRVKRHPLVISGTNNARLAGMLRQLAMYYHKDANNLFMVRLAQGLVHLGKGTLTIGPYHCDRTLMMPVAVGGLLSVLVSFLDVKNGKYLYSNSSLWDFLCVITTV